MLRPKNLTAASLMSFICLAAQPASPDDLAPAQAPGRTITAVGRGTASAEVDAAVLTVLVAGEGSFAQDAINAGATKVRRFVNALHDRNVTDADISQTHAQVWSRFVTQTPMLSSELLQSGVQSQASANAQGAGVGQGIPGQASPQPPRAATPAKMNGFRATTTIRIKTRDLAGLGALTDYIVDNADNQPTILFIVEDPRKFIDEARQKAFDNAERAARVDAERAHLKLVSVRAVRDEPPQSQLAELISKGVPVASNLNGGSESFSVAVEVEWNAEP
ncbi:MAG: SIMPL domain-containing protein [Hyphomicrobiales bacterium]|nr:SIMPL domain-containing protein [Hyphomicrobiales bacterium]